MVGQRARARVRHSVGAALITGAFVPLLAACGSTSTTPQSTQANLTVTLDPGVPTARPQTWKVSCPSPTHQTACRRLRETRDAFTSPPPDVACTLIYGGPEVLTVTGYVGDRRVDYHTGRANGCEIADYARDLALVAPFRPAGKTSSSGGAG